MTYLRAWAAVVPVALMVAGTAGCGLISSDVTNFDLTLPDKSFTIDAASWQVNGSDAQALLATSCAQAPSSCMTAAAQACQSGCSAACDSSTQTCDLSLDAQLFQTVNLEQEKPELSTINSEPVIHVTIDSVTYTVPTNTLNVATPPINIYVAPATVMDPNNAMAQLVGTLPGQPAGVTTSMPQTLMFTDAGKMDLINVMSTYKTPFNIIASSTLVVKNGDPVPMGKLEADVHIAAHAGI
jgi:hypothetical protein